MLDEQESNFKWTIGIVNYNSDVYIKWQLKILYEANEIKDFKLIIVDNSQPNQVEQLSALAAPYIKQFKNIEIVYHTPIAKEASSQHGEGLNIIKDLCQTKYILLQDPDFFWLQKNYLQVFEEYLSKGYVAIGAPYPGKMGIGKSDFPAVYGCAFIADKMKHLNLMPDVSRWDESFRIFPDAHFSFDVAWRIREVLSDEKYISLHQEVVNKELSYLIGVHTYEIISRYYYLKNKLLGFHLFRGNFTGTVEGYSDPKTTIEPAWLQARDNYGKFFYQLIMKKPRAKLILFQLKWLILKESLKTFLLRGVLRLKFVIRMLKKTSLGTKVIVILKKILLPQT